MTKILRFEWDERKRIVNLEKHGLDFPDACRVFAGDYKNWRSDSKGEIRWIAVGLLHGLEIAVVFTMRGDVIRLISARRAKVDERRKYYQDNAG